MNTKRIPAAIRFERMVAKAGPNDCWEWTGARCPKGYGRFSVRGARPGLNISVVASRFAYELANGPIAEGLQIDHACRNPPCVNPAHLEAVTPRANTLRGIGIAANHARARKCVRGHEFTEENTWRGKAGTRQCRKCFAIRTRATRQRKLDRLAQRHAVAGAS